MISYRVPAFRVSGKTIAGFAAFKNHLSYLPFSGSVIGQLLNELDHYTTTKSSVHFPIDRPLPNALVEKLIQGFRRPARASGGDGLRVGRDAPGGGAGGAGRDRRLLDRGPSVRWLELRRSLVEMVDI